MNFLIHIILSLFLNITLVCGGQKLWHSYRFGTGYDTREELYIVEVKSDEHFHIGQDVHKWKSINLGGLSYAVGILPKGLVILQAVPGNGKNKFIFSNNTISLDIEVSDLFIMRNWNTNLQKTEVVVAAASLEGENSLQWYKLRQNLTLEKFWSWDLCKRISHLNYFVQDYKHKLLIINEGENPRADLYEFTIGKDQNTFWLNQYLPLANPTNSSAISMRGPDYYISIPQKSLDLVLIYKFVKDHFVPYKNITCKEADNVVSFRIAFKPHIAIAGRNGGIFRFTKNDLEKVEVQGTNLQGVRFWYTVPVTNYRDEVILLSQRELNTETHNSLVFEIISYNRGNLVLHEDMTCNFHGEVVQGLECIADEERNEGIIGLTAIHVGSLLGLVIPRKDSPSGLIMLNATLNLLPDLVDEETKKISESRKQLQAMIDDVKEMYASYKDETTKPQKLIEANIVSSPWQATTSSSAAAYSDSKPFQFPNIDNKFAEVRADFERQLDASKQQIAEMRNKLDFYLQSTQDRKSVKRLILNGIVQIEGESDFKEIDVKNINGEPVDQVFQDTVRLNKIDEIPSVKDFQDIEVESIEFDNVNGVPANNISFSSDGNIEIVGDFVFQNNITVVNNVEVESRRVNDIILENEVITTGNFYNVSLTFENITLQDEAQARFVNKMPMESNYQNKIPSSENSAFIESIKLDNLYLPGNLTTVNINGENLLGLVGSLCMRNVPTYILGDTKIIGDVEVSQNAFTHHLNGLAFPEEYVFSEVNGYAIISGEKVFPGTVFADEVITRDKINGIIPYNIITLSKNQSIPATLIFNDLEVTVGLEMIGGKIIGEDIKEFLPNPTLLESRKILSNANFKNLDVTGKIILNNDSFNGTNFKRLLSNVLYKDENRHTVSAVKEFPNSLTVRDLNITSNSISNINIDRFITKNTEQKFAMPRLHGAVTFEQLYITGEYNGVNVTKLDQDIVKTSGDQFISQLVFEKDLFVEDLEISEKLNNIEVPRYVFATGDLDLGAFAEFLNISVESMTVGGNVNTFIENFDLQDFDQRRLSRSKNQDIEAPYKVKKVLAKHVNIQKVNGTAFEELFGLNAQKDKLIDLINSGAIKIRNLKVGDSIKIDSADGVEMDTVFKKGSLQQKFFEGDFDTVIFENALTVGHVNALAIDGVKFDDLMEIVVFKNESSVVLEGYKYYLQGLEVDKYIKTDAINNIPVENILKRNGKQTIQGPINIHGNVLVEGNPNVEGNLSDIPMEMLRNSFRTVDENTYQVNGDINFSRLVEANELRASNINDIEMSSLLPNIIYPNVSRQRMHIKGNTRFVFPVNIIGNLDIEDTINNVHLEKLSSQSIMITKDQEIDGILEFAQPTILEDHLNLGGNLHARYLMGNDLQYWFDNALYTDKGRINGSVTFQDATAGGNVYAAIVNDIRMCTLIPLKQDQSINTTLNFVEVSSFKDIYVGNRVNGYNLTQEFHNTILTEYYEQNIPGNIMFEEEVAVTNQLKISGTVNNVPLDRLVTTNTNQTLYGVYKFLKKVTAEADVQLHGLLSDVNITNWLNTGVKISSNNTQNINACWTVDKNVTFIEDVRSLGVIGDFNLPRTVGLLKDKIEEKYRLESKVIRDYEQMCEDVNYIVRRTKKQIFAYKYLENVQGTLELESEVENIHHFQLDGYSYIVISERGNCYSHLLVWMGEEFVYQLTLELGLVCDFISVKKEEVLYFVTRSCPVALDSKICNVTGTSLWELQNRTVKFMDRLEDTFKLQESHLPGTFYAMNRNDVVEYKIKSTLAPAVIKYRTWKIPEKNFKFVPRTLRKGLAVATKRKLYKLVVGDPLVPEDVGYETQNVITGEVAEENNDILPGDHISEVLVMNVGLPKKTRQLVAIAGHEETWIKSGLDLIKIYDDLAMESLFQKISAYKPSSPVAMEFENGETLLAFLEDQSKLHIYEYKGIEGFKHRSTASLKGSKLFTINVETDVYLLGVINANKITILKAVISGNRLDQDELDCEL